jgi:hypothetical protein
MLYNAPVRKIVTKKERFWMEEQEVASMTDFGKTYTPLD